MSDSKRSMQPTKKLKKNKCAQTHIRLIIRSDSLQAYTNMGTQPQPQPTQPPPQPTQPQLTRPQLRPRPTRPQPRPTRPRRLDLNPLNLQLNPPNLHLKVNLTPPNFNLHLLLNLDLNLNPLDLNISLLASFTCKNIQWSMKLHLLVMLVETMMGIKSQYSQKGMGKQVLLMSWHMI